MQKTMLYLVSTPIGNLEDITIRALRILRTVDIVLAEDTRRASILFNRYQIKQKAISFHEHNKIQRTKHALALLQAGKQVAIISEAGTPGVSDPGFFLIRECVKKNIAFTAVPGPCAAINALLLSGFPPDSFLFAGFLPVKKGKRKNELKRLHAYHQTLIVFESCHRLLSALEDIGDIFKGRQVAVVREMTKVYETVERGEASKVLAGCGRAPVRGEYVIVIDNR